MSNFFPVGKQGAKTTYSSKSECEAAEGQACYDVTGLDVSTLEVVDGALTVSQTKLSEKMQNIEKGAEIAQYEAVGQARRLFGQRLISITTGYTASLNLTVQQSLGLASSLSQIMTLANLGRIDLAKNAIEAYVPDQYFTQTFKDLLLWEIERNGY